MTKQEKLADKWRALSNPQSIEDYSVTMTFDEISRVPEAVSEVSKYIPINFLRTEELVRGNTKHHRRR